MKICNTEYLFSIRKRVKERRAYDIKNNLRYVTKEEIREAKLELWNKLKPQNAES